MSALVSTLLRRSQRLWVTAIIASGHTEMAIRYLRNPTPAHSVRVLRAFGATIGEGTTIKRSLHLDNVHRDRNSTGDFSHIRIGSNCYIGDGVYFDLANEVILDDNAILSGGVSILTHADCNRSPVLVEQFPRECLPVHIKTGAWIGFGATILAGSVIEKNAVVGAQSLVNGRVEAHSLYAGAPARKIRELNSPTR